MATNGHSNGGSTKAAVAWGPGEQLPERMDVGAKVVFTSICRTALNFWKGEETEKLSSITMATNGYFNGGSTKALVMEEVQVAPPERMDVGVKVVFTSICRTALSFWKGENERQRRFPRILGHEAAAGRRAAQALLLLLLLLLLLCQAQAQDAGSRLSGTGAGQPAPPPTCPAATPGIWALVVVLGIIAALSVGYIVHSEVTVRRARKAARERARERSRAAANGGAWGYPPNAPPLPRYGPI